MHYINGRKAEPGDQVIHVDPKSRNLRVGTIYNLNGSAETCNANFAYVIPGGVSNNNYVTIGECYHAADGVVALEGANSDPSP